MAGSHLSPPPPLLPIPPFFPTSGCYKSLLLHVSRAGLETRCCRNLAYLVIWIYGELHHRAVGLLSFPFFSWFGLSPPSDVNDINVLLTLTP